MGAGMAVGSILGPLIGGGMQAGFANAQTKKARAWMERMSNTAYQRAMWDMRKAGLNPILAYKQGGASTPGGPMAQTPDFVKAFSNAAQGLKFSQELKNMKAQEGQIGAAAQLSTAQAATAAATAKRTASEAEITRMRETRYRKNPLLMDAEMGRRAAGFPFGSILGAGMGTSARYPKVPTGDIWPDIQRFFKHMKTKDDEFVKDRRQKHERMKRDKEFEESIWR